MSVQDRRWLALIVLCIGDLMIVLDTTIVNVALPSIQADLGFSSTSLAWVINAYMLTFGGFLLLGGRLGDLFGHRKLFLIGIVLFTLSSLVCGLATSKEMLILARGVQGLGGAIVSVVALSLAMIMFTEAGERAKAMGIIGFVVSGGGTMGVVLGGILTDLLSWHWIFLVNIPIGVGVFIYTRRLVSKVESPAARGSIDIAGAVTITASLMLAVYAIVNGNDAHWGSTQTLGLLGLAAVLFVVFLVIETRAKAPLMPLSIFRIRSVSVSNVVGVLTAAGMFAAFFLSALYLQRVLGYTPLEVGLAYLPMTLIWGGMSLFASGRLVMRFGFKPPLVVGLSLLAAGLFYFSRLPVDGNFFVNILPAMVLQGLGAGIAFNPILLAAMSEVDQKDAGLASGVVNTSMMMGGALGLAILASSAASRTSKLVAEGESQAAALTGGYKLAFLIGAFFTLAAAIISGTLLHSRKQEIGEQEIEAGGVAVSAEAD